MQEIKIGTTLEVEEMITNQHTAKSVESGDLEVLATPVMIGLMEKAAANCLNKFLEQDKTSVGTEIDVSHLCATPIGMKVVAKAEVIEVENRRIVFKISAHDGVDLIGEGTHERFIVEREKFTQRTLAKLEGSQN